MWAPKFGANPLFYDCFGLPLSSASWEVGCVTTNTEFHLGCGNGIGRRSLFAALGHAMAALAVSKPHWTICLCHDRLAGLAFAQVHTGHGRLDVSSLTAAWLMKLSHVLVMWALTGAQASLLAILMASVLGLLHWVISGLTGIVLLYAILSWVQPNSGSMMLLSRLVAPFLTPLRNALPQPGGIDLSPLVLLVLLQVIGMLLAGLQFN
jgi:uncharacterized protein YggT (Ycf19 family)